MNHRDADERQAETGGNADSVKAEWRARVHEPIDGVLTAEQEQRLREWIAPGDARQTFNLHYVSRLLNALDATRAELEAYREAAGFRDPEDFATKDRMRTREHNLLTAENRSLSAELAAERERCAMACEADEAESLRVPGVNRWDDSPATARRCAAAIRALATAPAPSAPKAEGGDRG